MRLRFGNALRAKIPLMRLRFGNALRGCIPLMRLHFGNALRGCIAAATRPRRRNGTLGLFVCRYAAFLQEQQSALSFWGCLPLPRLSAGTKLCPFFSHSAFSPPFCRNKTLSFFFFVPGAACWRAASRPLLYVRCYAAFLRTNQIIVYPLRRFLQEQDSCSFFF